MENKNIIIILIVIIILLSVSVGTMYLQSVNTKTPTEVKIISNPTLCEGDELAIQLACLDGTAISKETVDIVIADENGDVLVNETVKTDSEGKAKIDLDLKKGKYDVNATFRGNEIYIDDIATQILRINETTTNAVSDENTADMNNYPKYSPDLGYYRSTGIGQDEMGVVELAGGRYIVVAGDGYYEYGGQDAQGNIIRGSFLGHGGSRIY